MDISETYIKMCKKAEEIQALRPEGMEWEEGDYYHYESKWNDGSYDAVAHEFDEGMEKRDSNPSKGAYSVWLPRQEQLQEMMEEYGKWEIERFPAPYLEGFHQYEMTIDLPDGRGRIEIDGDTLEQVWLSFVMSELCHKKWYKGEWIE